MALQPTDTGLLNRGSFFDRVLGLFGWRQHYQFSPNEVLAESSGMDPLLVPRVPMTSERIDPALMLQFRSMGFTHAVEITERTHPELYLGWVELCRRAGFSRPLQLIVTDSKDPNAIDASDKEVVVSTGLLKMLTAREILGVLGHELGHAKHDANNNNRAWIEGTGLIGGGMVGHQAGKYLQQGFYGPLEGTIDRLTSKVTWSQKQPGFLMRNALEAAQLVGTIVTAMGGWMVSKQFSVKPSELRADKVGAQLTGDPQGLITAFEKMGSMAGKQPGWKQFLRYAFSGYPTFDQRIAQLRQMESQLPPNQTPIYRMVELLAANPTNSMTTLPMPPAAAAEATPELHIHGLKQAERVVATPDKAQMC